MSELEIQKDKYLESLMSTNTNFDSSSLYITNRTSSDSNVPITIEQLIKFEIEKQLAPIKETQNALIQQTAELAIEIDSIKEEESNIIQTFTENYQLKKQIKNINNLNSYKSFKHNWNGNFAEPFSEELINKVLDIVNSTSLKFQPNLFPTGRQSIQFEYEKSNGNYLEIEITNNNISGFSIISDEESNFETLRLNDLIKIINGFHSKI